MPRRVESLAEKLLDAQVAFHLERLTGDDLAVTVTALADDLLSAAGQRRIDDLVDRDAARDLVVRVLGTVPGSAAVADVVELVTAAAYAGPAEPFSLGEIVPREHVESLVDELLDLVPLLERALDRLNDSPLVGTVASRFMGRIVGEVVQANRAVAGKVPGLGALVSFGTSAASKVVGAADKQLEGLLGDTMGKGGTYAVGRLNKIVVETLRDPTTRDALLQVWDLVAEEQVRGLGRHASREDVSAVVGATHALVVTTATSEHAARLGGAAVDAFLDRFGEHTLDRLLAELGLGRDVVVADLVRIAPGLVDALRQTGDLERLLRARLEPFYASPEVAAILE